MRAIRLLALLLFALTGVGWNVGCGDDDDEIDVDVEEDGTIVDVANSSEDFESFSAALADADLDSELSGDGPFTVFAPTDEAFERLPAGTLDNLSEEDMQRLLLYHVGPGRISSDDLDNGPITTSADVTAFVEVDDDLADDLDIGDRDIHVNDVQVVDTDIEATNGIIHAIDQVLIPPDIIAALELAGDFDQTLAAVDRVDLTDELRGPGPFTVFAPTDEAIDDLPDDTIENLSDEQLTNVLLYHVVDERMLTSDLTAGQVETMLGEDVAIDPSDDEVRVQGARIVGSEILATNGVIHAIDQVLLPPTQ
jgi:transforming growth factor-beta-induced protein